jgi:hypothetical protein
MVHMKMHFNSAHLIKWGAILILLSQNISEQKKGRLNKMGGHFLYPFY